MKIEVKSTEIHTKSGTSAKTGRPYSIREQDTYWHMLDRNGKPQPFPVRVCVTLEDDQQPYPIGTYELAPESFWVNRFSQAEIKPVLRAVAASLNKAA